MEEIVVRTEARDLSVEVDRNAFARALKTWRIRKGMTQKEVADIFGCSRYSIMRAETGQQLSWEMAYRLFACLAEELRKEGKA